MNQKDLRIKKMVERGITDKGKIARAIGYAGSMDEGIKRVEEGLKRISMTSPNNKMMSSPIEK